MTFMSPLEIKMVDGYLILRNSVNFLRYDNDIVVILK